MEQLAGHQDDLSGQLSRRPRGRRRYTRAGCKVAFLSPWLAVPVLLVCFLFSVAVITGCGEEQNGEPGEAGIVEPGTVESETTESVADRGEPAGAEGRWEEFVTLTLANETCLECHDLLRSVQASTRTNFLIVFTCGNLLTCLLYTSPSPRD